MLRRKALSAFALLGLAACADDRARYPSLEQRAVERAYGSAEPVAAPTPDAEAPLPANSGTIARIVALKQQAVASHAKFTAQRPGALRLAAAARGAARGSEAWAQATLALARLESARSQTLVAMADLDRLLLATSLADAQAPSPDLAPVQAAHAEIEALVGEEDAGVAAVASALGG